MSSTDRLETTLDVSQGGPTPPFRFWLAEQPPPSPSPPGMRVYEVDNAVMNAYPPGVYEVADQLPDRPELWSIYYCLQADLKDYTIFSCFDHYYDFADAVMQSSDHGEKVTKLLQREWPLFCKLRDAGLRGQIANGCLVRLRTSSDVQWCVALRLTGVEFTRIEQMREGAVGKAFSKVQRLTHDLMEETSMNVFSLPGFIEATGGRDWTARMKKVEKGFKIAEDVYEVVKLFSD